MVAFNLLGTGRLYDCYRLGLFGLVRHNLIGALRFITVKDDRNMLDLYKLCFRAIKMVLLSIKVRYHKVLQRSYFWQAKRCKNYEIVGEHGAKRDVAMTSRCFMLPSVD